MGERLLCKQEVTGSIPVGSILRSPCTGAGFGGWESTCIADDRR
jgi:hypothetical protein